MTCNCSIINAKTDKSRVFCPHSSIRPHNWVHNESGRSKNRLAGQSSRTKLEFWKQGWTNAYTLVRPNINLRAQFRVRLKNSFLSKERFFENSQEIDPQKDFPIYGLFEERTRLIFPCWNIEEIKISRQLDDLLN